MAEPEDLGESIMRRYAESPGVIPQRFGMGIVRRLEGQGSALAGEIQRRWRPGDVEAGGVRWPETFAAVGTAGTVASAAMPERSAVATGKSIQRAPAISAGELIVDTAERPVADAVSTAMPVVKVAVNAVQAAGVKAIQRKAAVSETAGALPIERQSFESSAPMSGVAPSVARMSVQSRPVVTPSPVHSSALRAPAVVNRARTPTVQRKVRVQEHTPTMLRDAEMASFQVGTGSALPISVTTPVVLPRTIQRSAAPASNVDIAPSSSTDASVTQPISQGSTKQESNDSSNQTDRTMQQILRRLAIERERRGGGKWL